jgi:hypothetical protein
VYDLPVASFDLTEGGQIFSSVIKSFGEKFIGLPEDLEQYLHVEEASANE